MKLLRYLCIVIMLSFTLKVTAFEPVLSIKAEKEVLKNHLFKNSDFFQTICDLKDLNIAFNSILSILDEESFLYLNLYKLPNNPFKVYPLLAVEAGKKEIFLKEESAVKSIKKENYYLFGDEILFSEFNSSQLSRLKSDPGNFVALLPVEQVYSYFYPMIILYKGILNMQHAENSLMQMNMNMLFESILAIVEELKFVLLSENEKIYHSDFIFKEGSLIPLIFNESCSESDEIYGKVKSYYSAVSSSINIKNINFYVKKLNKRLYNVKIIGKDLYNSMNEKLDDFTFKGKTESVNLKALVDNKDGVFNGGVKFSWEGESLNKEAVTGWIKKNFADFPIQFDLIKNTTSDNIKLKLKLKELESLEKTIPPLILIYLKQIFLTNKEMVFELVLEDNSITCLINKGFPATTFSKENNHFIYLNRDILSSVFQQSAKESFKDSKFFDANVFLMLNRGKDSLSFTMKRDN